MDAILSRRSIRKYTGEPVSDEDLHYFLEAAMAAPSAGNQQPWHFVVARDRATLDAIPDLHPHARMMKQAQAAILVCGETEGLTHPHHMPHDCSAATENILLAIESRGLGGVWLGVYPNEDRVAGMRELFGVREPIVPFSLVAIGHPSETKPPSERYDESRVHSERW
jgi:nitroreductase